MSPLVTRPKKLEEEEEEEEGATVRPMMGQQFGGVGRGQGEGEGLSVSRKKEGKGFVEGYLRGRTGSISDCWCNPSLSFP